ncbi:MAG: Gfo/Idh/MocA family oxidoreductase [Planctomycetaceae bacterium]|nr:Gfo/Idh/MocA family oxidoreductase [Planctomycetaceae bacterium]
MGLSRRQFLGHSAQQAATVAAGVAGLTGAAFAGLGDDRVRLGVIGLRNRGRELLEQLATLPNAEVVALCDVDDVPLAKAESYLSATHRSRVTIEHDYRRLLDNPRIDAIVVATPDHSHVPIALAACDAGKDVYLETPGTHSYAEGWWLLAAIARTGRIVQTGVTERSVAAIDSAIEVVRSGRLGNVRTARAWVAHRRRPIPPKAIGDAPENVDYATWLGPHGERPFQANRFHFNWRWYWDHGGGELTHWGVRWIDVACRALQPGSPETVQAVGGKYHFHDDQETPDTLTVHWQFGGSQLTWEHRLWSPHGWEGRSSGVAFYGEQGTLVVDRAGWKIYEQSAGAETASGDATRDHLSDFLQAVLTRRQPKAAFSELREAEGLCHLGNVAYRVGRPLHFDARSQKVTGDDEANRLLLPPYAMA